MTLLADIGLAVRGAIGGDVFPVATLHVATDMTNAAGETVKAFADHPTTGFVGEWKSDVAVVRGYPADAAKIVLVQGRLSKARDWSRGHGRAPADR